MGLWDIIAWVVMGGLAGWVASLIMKKKGTTVLMNIIVGIVGAFVGGFIMSQFGGSGVSGFNLQSFLVATGGSVVVLAVINLITKGKLK
ncbi:MAG: GlsB/YeaQ/YmgE family stress response membrane protein [Clostridiaceae bacterium]|nr:GlsB/YeaQ/YmgE family stress response membrane protein [Clostridiaceae bacterium]